MSERYSKLSALPENLYSTGAPVIIAAGALLKDNQTGKVLAQLKNGFLTVRGGHRIGVCGTVVVQGGEVTNLRQISSLAIRIAREVRGTARTVLPQLLDRGRRLAEQGLAVVEGSRVRLTREGFLVSNGAIEYLLWEV